MKVRKFMEWTAIGAAWMFLLLALCIGAYRLIPSRHLRTGDLAEASTVFPARAFMISTPTLGPITTATVTSSTDQSTDSTSAHIGLTFGTVTGTYTTCTVQAKTSYDGGTNYVNLGTAESITVTTNTANFWDILAQASVSTGVTVTTAPTGFGQYTQYVFACSGAYGTSAPVANFTVVYD